jgi:hypothetical protein
MRLPIIDNRSDEYIEERIDGLRREILSAEWPRFRRRPSGTANLSGEKEDVDIRLTIEPVHDLDAALV